MLTGLFVCAWLILWRAPATSLGRFLQHWMLDRPMARAARVTRGHLTLALLLLAGVAASVWLLQAEAGPLLGLASPEIGYLFASMEVTSWVDAVTGVLLAAATVRWRDLRVGGLLRQSARPRRRRQPRSHRPDLAPANDDERPTPAIAA